MLVVPCQFCKSMKCEWEREEIKIADRAKKPTKKCCFECKKGEKLCQTNYSCNVVQTLRNL